MQVRIWQFFIKLLPSICHWNPRRHLTIGRDIDFVSFSVFGRYLEFLAFGRLLEFHFPFLQNLWWQFSEENFLEIIRNSDELWYLNSDSHAEDQFLVIYLRLRLLCRLGEWSIRPLGGACPRDSLTWAWHCQHSWVSVSLASRWTRPCWQINIGHIYFWEFVVVSVRFIFFFEKINISSPQPEPDLQCVTVSNSPHCSPFS